MERYEAEIMFHSHLLRTLRMMRNYGEGDRNSARRHRAPQDSNTISGAAEIREKMIERVYDIVELNQRDNREQHIFNTQVCHSREFIRNRN